MCFFKSRGFIHRWGDHQGDVRDGDNGVLKAVLKLYLGFGKEAGGNFLRVPKPYIYFYYF